ncbi:MAG TPA: 2-phospho-L-lactate guanylyltransferase [Phototrophicaceae bacterium]|nr:2-phospho-L-lactate guanylyltransferase [Phototrophicaceae bacterium]
MSIWAIIPVKPLTQAKSRLEGALSPDERKQLSEMMFRRVLTTVKSVPQITGALVISRDSHALAIARDLGAHTVQESGAPELNNALMRATQVVGGWRGGAVLILPADLPLITADDVQGITELGQENMTVVVATDNHEDGTNAMLIRPPGMIPYAYGIGSFQRHMALAKEAGASVKVYHSDRLALDIDMPADLEKYYRLTGSAQGLTLTPGGTA